MKNLLSLAAVAAVLAPLAHLSAQTFTLTQYDEFANWTSPDIWSIEGETSQTYPLESGDVVMHNDSQTFGQVITVNASVNIDSLDIALRGGGGNHFKLLVSSGRTMQISEDSAINASYAWYQFMLGGTGSINFRKNLTLKNDISDLGSSQPSIISLGESNTGPLSLLRIGGDLNIEKNASGDMRVYMNANNITIGGSINIAQGAQLHLARCVTGVESVYSIGGINGGGNLFLGFNSNTYWNQKSVANITITNGGSWSGTFRKETTNAESRLNVTMSGSGTQDFRVSSATFVEGAANSNVIDALTVNSGVFNYGAGDFVSGSLILNGGKFGAASLMDSGTSADVGVARFENGIWNGGAIILDVSTVDATFDKIAFSGLFEKGEGDISLEFRFDAEGMAELVEMGFSTFEDMIVYAPGSSIEGAVLNGVSNGFAWEAVFGATGMDVTFSAVPEPAAIAVLFGFSALLFAAFRRGRK